jgi:hypothetical protein
MRESNNVKSEWSHVKEKFTANKVAIKQKSLLRHYVSK